MTEAAKQALTATRTLLREIIQEQIEGCCSPERFDRPGAIKSSIGLQCWYHPDTMDGLSRPYYRRVKRLLAKVEAALI